MAITWVDLWPISAQDAKNHSETTGGYQWLLVGIHDSSKPKSHDDDHGL